MAPSNAHAVQTSARPHATPPALDADMFDDQPAGDVATVRALRYTGRVLKDAQLEHRPTAAGLIPVVTFDMECHVGAVTFQIHVEHAYTTATRAAAGAKAGHCRKDTWVEVDAAHSDVRLVLPHCTEIRVLEGRPQ